MVTVNKTFSNVSIFRGATSLWYYMDSIVVLMFSRWKKSVFFFLSSIQKAVFLLTIMWRIFYVLCFWWLQVIKCLVIVLKKKVIFMSGTCIFYIHTVKQTLWKINEGFVANSDRWFNPNRDDLHPFISAMEPDALYSLKNSKNIEFLTHVELLQDGS